MLQVPKKYQGTYKKAVEGKASLRSAIKAFCQSCFGWSNVENEIPQCSDPACPLYKYRPAKRVKKS